MKRRRLGRLAELADVGARDEGAAATDDDHGADARVRRTLGDGVRQPLAYALRERVDGRIVDGDDADAALLLERYEITHGVPPWSRLSAASIRLSERVGCAWMVSARSSRVTALSMASAASAISSPAPGPTIPAPMTRPDAASTTSLVSPSLRPMVAARPEAAHGNFASLIARPARWASASIARTTRPRDR